VTAAGVSRAEDENGWLEGWHGENQQQPSERTPLAAGIQSSFARQSVCFEAS
jgi:hypothetical protein